MTTITQELLKMRAEHNEKMLTNLEEVYQIQIFIYCKLDLTAPIRDCQNRKSRCALPPFKDLTSLE